MARQSARARAFTLVELLVVLVIIGIVSAVALPTVLPALSHRQVSEAARILQGAIVGARDKAIHDGRPSGIRLVPDPAFASLDADGKLDPTRSLAYSRIVPLDVAPDYSEGAVTVRPGATYAAAVHNPDGDAAGTGVAVPSLVLEQAPVDAAGAPNAPTTWAWNIRVGDKVQLRGAGPWYTVCGPMWRPNPEGFVNYGTPGVTSPLVDPDSKSTIEWLILVDGRDNNGNGYIDDGWDGVDNNGDGVKDEYGEWLPNQGFPVASGETPSPPEAETWQGAAASGMTSAPYAIRRRPMPGSASREVALPTQMVIDATTAFGTRERSRLPVDPLSGNVDIMISPDGTAYYSSPYAAPTGLGLGDAFYHFWLAERQDVMAPIGTTAPTLPLPSGVAQAAGIATTQPDLKGEYAILTLNARTGVIVVNRNPPFFLGDSPTYNATNPFIPAEQGVSSP